MTAEQQRDELLVAVKGYRVALRPWLDAAAGNKTGTVTYAQWNAAVERLEAAIDAAAVAPVVKVCATCRYRRTGIKFDDCRRLNGPREMPIDGSGFCHRWEARSKQ